VARYADATNLFGAMPLEQLQHKLDVLRTHCEREGRNYDSIEKTVQFQMDVTGGSDATGPMVERLRHLSEMGFTRAIGSVREVEKLAPLEVLGREVIPQIAGL